MSTFLIPSQSAAATGDYASIALVPIVMLLVLLALRGLVASASGPRGQRLAQGVTVSIIPLVLIFIITVIIRFAETLRP